MNVLDFVYDFALISALLFVAKIIRAKVRFVQKLYIPSALIAGFLGLLLGEQFLNVIPFSGAISEYSAVLIAVLFGSMFLGNKTKASFKSMMHNVGDTFLVNGAAEMGQFGVFMIIGAVALPLLFEGIHEGFALMLPSGFVGGHGTAAAIGGVFAQNGWEDAVSIGQTFATIGLLGGIVGGVTLINICARRGKMEVIKSVEALPEEMLTGLVPQEKRTAVGENTVNSMSIDTLTWHLSLVLIAVGMAYAVNNVLKVVVPQVSFPVYGLALLCSIALQALLRLVKLDQYVDKQVVTHIGSSATDYLVAFGVASINISVVAQYWMPILLLCVLGFIFVIVWYFVVSPRFFRSYCYERGIYIYGMSTGVLATGVILLRIADPEFKSGVLEDFGFAWIFLSILDMLLVSMAPVFVLSGMGLVFGLALCVLAAVFLVICRKMFSGKKK